MTTICEKPCKYRKAVFCGLDFTMLNQFGQCLIWFDKQGRVRMEPDYRYELPIRKNQTEEKKQEQIEEKTSGDEPKNDESESEKNGSGE